jgi:large subunit ribosomal protein L1
MAPDSLTARGPAPWPAAIVVPSALPNIPSTATSPRSFITTMAKQSKRYRALVEGLDLKTPRDLSEAVQLLSKFGTTKFDQSVEVAMSLGIDPRQADQMVRGSVVLPHGIGKTLRVVVFAKGDKATEATEAGADAVGAEDLATRIKDGWLDFDVCIAAPDMMGLVGPLGRVLGPKGLMPSPRAGTVTPDISKAVREYKAGKVEFRNDAGGNVHAIVGKISFPPEKLQENIAAFIEYIKALKPQTVKGAYVKNVTVSATMSPGIPVIAT